MACSHRSHYLITGRKKILYLKYTVEAAGLIIFIFPFWFYRQENEAWDGEETCTDITW